MSFSIQIIGKPESVARELNAFATNLSGQSLQEYEEVKPHLQALVRQVVSSFGVLICLKATGHATFQDGRRIEGSLSVSLENFFGIIAGP